MSRRSLVTGAGGFVGANLVRRLRDDGDEIVAVTRPDADRWRLQGVDADVVELDLEDAGAVASAVGAARPDRVFHLAAHGAYSWQDDRRRILGTNVLGTLHLLDACVAAGVHAFVNAGSSSEYGYRDHAPSEDEAPEPNSDYAATKAAATLFAGHIGRSTALHVVTLRLYSVYGPWEEPARFVPTLVKHALRGELPPLVDPAVARDFVYVGDVCDAFVLAGESDVPSGSIYNIGSGVQTTIGEAVATARSLFGIATEPQWGAMERRRWDTSTWVSDPSRAAAELRWRAATPLADGLRATAVWLRSSESRSAEA